MKKILSIIILSLLFSGNAYAEDSYEDAFKKALDNHQYYFKHKGKNHTTDTKDKPFDFFDHGFKDYRSSAKYMIENYPDDKSRRCFMFKGKQWGFDGKRINDTDTFYTYLDYDKDGWQNKILTTSNNKLIKVVFHEDNGCRNQDTFFEVFFKDKLFYDSRKDYEELTSDGWRIFLNINFYIDKDYNKNGKNELFIDAGYRIGNNWIEQYYFFEYDKSSVKLVKNFAVDDWKERLGVSDHFKARFEVTEEELVKIINKNFSVDTPKNYYNDYLTNCSQSSPSYFSFDSENADITEVEIFKGKKLDINCLVEKFENHRKKFPITSYLSDEVLRSRPIIEYKEVKKSKNDNAQYVGLDISSIADQKCGETCIYTTEALLIYDDTYWYIKGNNNRGLKAILESKNKILITNFMSTHQRQYTFENNKIKRVKKKNTSTKKKINTKMFSSSLTGLSFSLTDDWYLSSEASTKELGDKLSGERKEYLKSMLKKSKVSSFEVLYNEKFVPDVITITRLNMPRNFSITKSNVKKNCKQIIKVNERATGKKGTLYDCKYVQNRVSGYEGALYISHKDDISIEEGNVIANQIIFIIDSQAVYFSTSCKKYCKEVTENIYAISSTLKKN